MLTYLSVVLSVARTCLCLVCGWTLSSMFDCPKMAAQPTCCYVFAVRVHALLSLPRSSLLRLPFWPSGSTEAWSRSAAKMCALRLTSGPADGFKPLGVLGLFLFSMKPLGNQFNHLVSGPLAEEVGVKENQQ